MASKLIDIHPHIISPDTDRYPVTPIGGMQSDWSKEHSVDLDQLLAEMDKAGVDKAALVHSSTTYGFNNDYVADAVAAHPGRLTGVFSVDFTQADAPERIRYWHAKGGLTGLRIYARGSKIKEAWLAIDDPACLPAWECAAELGLPVAHNMNAFGESLEQIKSIARLFPQVSQIIDHLGRPPTADGPPYAAAKEFWALSEFPNVYLKLTPRLHNVVKEKATVDTFVAKLVEVFGADRIAWGSNYPSSSGTLAEIVADAKVSCRVLSDEDRSWIFARTAQKLYPSLAD
jgi:L-fuconolactonase